ncbi:unnamed protein product, partial [Fusarium fujikuroi]
TESDNIDCASVWGDFVGLDDEGEVEDACEPIERYEEGLYYPVCIGEVLIDRYCVEHKLGHSGFSTVWMAYNMLSNNNIALKIISPGPSGEREYTTQTMIASTIPFYCLVLLRYTTESWSSLYWALACRYMPLLYLLPLGGYL